MVRIVSLGDWLVKARNSLEKFGVVCIDSKQVVQLCLELFGAVFGGFLQVPLM
jgi:hypothetical protein